MQPAAKMEPSATEPAWRLGFRTLETEHLDPIELPVRGEIPDEIVGTLYRNGPARLVIQGEPLLHWFDGDAMIHSFQIERDRIAYRNRFVRTPEHLREEQERRRIYACFETPAAGGPLRRFLGRNERKNGANTHVLMHAGTLYALWEGGWPLRIDPVTLEYLGADGLDGLLDKDESYSAHPRLDDATGELWNFGMLFGRTPTTRIYARDASGKNRRIAEVEMPQPSMQHDFGLTSKYAVLKFDPYVLPRFPLWLILGQKSYAQCLSWRPDLGMHFVLVPRDGGPPRTASVDVRFAEHVIHAFDDGEDVVIDLIAYPDARVIQTLKEVLSGEIKTQALAFPERVRIPASGRATIERLGDVPLELTRHLARVGERYRYVFAVAWSDPASLLNAPARLDTETRRTEIAPMAPGEYAGECVPVAKRGARNDGAAWLLTVVLNAAANRSELRVYDGENLAAPPVAVADLPYIVPFGFHGSFVKNP